MFHVHRYDTTVRFFRLACLVFWGLQLLASASLKADQRNVQIVLGAIQCYKTTSGAGDDQPYLVVVAADLRSGSVIFGSHEFGDVGEDDWPQANIVVGSFSPLERPDDCVLLVALLERDHPGISFDGDGLHSFAVRKAAVEKITPIVKKYQAQYAVSIKSRPQIEQEIAVAMNQAISETQKDDDRIGMEILRLQLEDIEGPDDRSVERRAVLMGDGGAYVVYLNIKSSDKMFEPNVAGIGGAVKKPNPSIPDVGGAVGGPNSISPNGPVFAALTGKWNSNLGPVELIQDGQLLNGIVRFPNQAIGKVTGKITKQAIDCRWFVHAGHEGAAKLAISNDGNTLTGGFTSSNDPNFKGEWKLTREVKKPTVPSEPIPGIGGATGGGNAQASVPNLVGIWKQIPGGTGLPAVDVTIGQDNAHPENFACRIPQMTLFAKGKVTKDGNVTASFGQPNADMSDFGPLGIFNTATGKITKTDTAGRALRIEWSNGVAYERK